MRNAAHTIHWSSQKRWLALIAFSVLELVALPALSSPESTQEKAVGETPAQEAPQAVEPQSPLKTAIDEAALLPLVLDFARNDEPKTQIEALRQAQLLKHPFLLPHIRYLARVGQTNVRIVACETLAVYKNVHGLVELQLAANDAEEPLALRAIALLAEFPLPMIRQELIEIARKPSSTQPRKKAAIRSLQAMATPQAQEALASLAKELPEALAHLALQKAGNDEGSEPTKLLLLRRLFTTDHIPGRIAAIEQITQNFSSGQALQLLRTCLEDPDPTIRHEALNAAGGLQTADLETLLKEVLGATDPRIQRTWLKLIPKLSADQARPLLLRAIQTQYNASMRRAALKQLSLPIHLEDTKTTTALVELFQNSTTDPAQFALATALSLRTSQEALNALTHSLGRADVKEAVRMLAFETLIKQQPPTLVETLTVLARDEPSLDIRKKAAAELVLNHCDELGEQCSDFDYHYATDAAAGLYYTVSGAMGAASLGLLSKVAGGNQPAIAALSGAVLGSGTAYMLAPPEGITAPEAFHFTSLGLWGSALGYGIGAVAVDGLENPNFTWTFLGGQLLGTAMGAYTFRETSHTTSDLALMHWTGVEVTTATLGALVLWGDDNPSDYQKQMGPALATLTGLGLGVMPMWFLASDLEFSETDPALITLGTLGSGVLGGLAAHGTSDKDGASVGGFLLGQGIGYAASVVASQYTDLTKGQLSWITMGTSLGATAGAGIGVLAQSDNSQTQALSAFIGGLTLTAATALSADSFDLTWSDADLALYSGITGTVLGGSIALMSSEDFQGPALIGASTGLLAGLIYDHLKPMSLRDSSLGASGTLAGLILGAGTAFLLPNEPSEELAGALIGTGALLGYSSMLWAAPKLQFSNGDYLGIFGSMAIGGFVGGSLPGLIYGSEEQDAQTLGGAMLGTALGYGTGLAISQFTDMSTADVTETILMTSLGGLLGQGLTAFTADGNESTRANRALTLSGTALGLASGYYFAEKTNYESEDYWLISYLSAYGGFNGAWFPGLWLKATEDEDFSNQATGGAMVGTVLGATSGIILSQYENFTFGDVNEMALGSIASSIFGAGVGLMVPIDGEDDMRPWVAGMQVAGVLGTAAVGLMAPHTDFSAGDTTLGFLATAYGAWQGAGASLLLDGTERQVAGAVLATTALGAAGGALISQHVEATTAELFAAFSGSVWGAWIGGMGSIALKQDFDVELSNKELLGSFFVASDLGLIATALAMSPVMKMKPEQVGWINLYGLSGMALGSALGAIFPNVPFWTSNVSGSAVGLITGAVVTSLIEMPSLQSEVTPVETEMEEASGSESKGFYYPGQISAILPQFQITPITGPDGRIVAQGNRFLLGLMGLWD